MIFTKKQIANYADILIFGLKKSRRGQNFKPYDTVMVRYNPLAIDLIEELHRKLTKEKFNVMLRPSTSPQIEKDSYDFSDEKQLKFVPAGHKQYLENLNGYIFVRAPEALDHLKNVDPKKFKIGDLSYKKFREILDKREDKGLFSWTLCMYPTKVLAKAAGLSLKQYSAQIAKACYLNAPNAVKKWKEIFESSAEIKKRLNSLKIDTLLLQSKSVDLKIKLGEKRKFVSSDGCNMPSFEIFTSPDWRGTEGVYYSDLPGYERGNYYDKIKLTFKEGRVVKATAKSGEKFLKKIIKTDKGAAQIGEFSLTDKRFSKIDKFMANILFDENHGGKYGNSHIALGSSFSDTFTGDPKKLNKALKKKFGFNESAVHWDIINTEDKTVKAVLKNGKTVTIYENGMFKD